MCARTLENLEDSFTYRPISFPLSHSFLLSTYLRIICSIRGSVHDSSINLAGYKNVKNNVIKPTKTFLYSSVKTRRTLLIYIKKKRYDDLFVLSHINTRDESDFVKFCGTVLVLVVVDVRRRLNTTRSGHYFYKLGKFLYCISASPCTKHSLVNRNGN